MNHYMMQINNDSDSCSQKKLVSIFKEEKLNEVVCDCR